MSSEDNLDNGDKGMDGPTVVVHPNDVDETPRVEVPVAVKVSTPSTVMAESAQEPNGITGHGYFAARPAASELQRHPVFTSSPSASPPPSPGTVSLPERAGASASESLQLPSRPTVYSTDSSLSVQSADSASTITAASSAPVLTPSGHPRPDFPNQAYSALHSQQHPTSRGLPPSLRQRGTHPGQIFTFASALASRHQPGARTVGSSAPVTPGVGLYTPQPAPTSSDFESLAAPGTYASPFLHFTQRSQPKETTVADVDVDPISGRKLINHYEIIDELGRGTHGKVKLGRDLKTDTHVAIKIVERFSKRRKLGKLGTTEDKVMKEVAILKQVRHPNVTALLEVIDDPTRKKVYIVLEWVELGQIQWRKKGAKEITLIEARRYERERSGKTNKQLEAEDDAIVKEAQKRLMRRRRKDLRTFRQIRQETPSEVWSVETAGDDEESGTSDDDKLSRVSTESYSNMLLHNDGRRSSRTPSPLPPLPTNEVDLTSRYLPLTSEPLSHSPLTLTNVYTGLEGTMYGAYTSSVPSSADHSRGSSGNASDPLRRRAMTSSESLARLASEALDREINDELENVPVLTIQQIRVAFRDTLLGLQYLHYQGIIHRDIKPPNLLETREHRVKISDFGVSYLGRPKGEDEDLEDVSEHEAQDLDDGAKELAKTVGTPAFYAPELCITEPVEDAPPITGAIDVWALGVTLFCMLFARTPFVDNEFVVMRQIAEEDVYLPRKRLKPVEPKPRSRPSSQRRVYQPTASERRHDLELAYEDISDDLYDLLKRMLVKDPRKRIKLDEIRHHPWVTADIQDKVKWLEETDPPRQNKGKKIQVTKEDVNAAVVPLQFLDRVRTTIKNFGERLGFTSKPASRGRTRSSIGGGIETSPSPSNASNSTNLSREVLRNNSRDEDFLRSPLKATHENGHPLSTSVNPSPEQEAKSRDLNDTSVPEAPPALSSLHPVSELTGHSEAASGSMRTVRQSDFHAGNGDDSTPSSPGMTEASTSLESPVSDIVGAAGGRVRRMFRSVRERSLARSSDGRAPSADRASLGSIDTHGDPSLALSSASAVGQINSPIISGQFTPTSPVSSARNSPSASRPLSAVTSPSTDRLYPSVDALSRTSSSRSISSLGRTALGLNPDVTRSPARPQSWVPPGINSEERQRAVDDEHIRKRLQEERDRVERLESEPASPFDDRTCPPSPDDQRQQQLPRSRRMSALDISNADSSEEPSPTGQGAQLQAAMASSTSDFASSASMSNPSMPSVLSQASSMDLPEPVLPGELTKGTTSDLLSSDDTVHPAEVRAFSQRDHYGEIYDDNEGDLERAGENEDYDDSSDSDGGLVMSRRKSAAKPSESKDDASLPHSVSVSSKSSRRGSNSTTLKMSPRESADEQIPTDLESPQS